MGSDTHELCRLSLWQRCCGLRGRAPSRIARSAAQNVLLAPLQLCHLQVSVEDPALGDLRAELMQFDAGPPNTLAEGSFAALIARTQSGRASSPFLIPHWSPLLVYHAYSILLFCVAQLQLREVDPKIIQDPSLKAEAALRESNGSKSAALRWSSLQPATPRQGNALWLYL